MDRRDLLASVVAGAVAATPLAANAVSARTGLSSVFSGEYDDPNHPGCLRSIKVVGPKMGPDGRKGRNPVAYIKGVDNAKDTKSCVNPPELSQIWKLEGKVAEDGESVLIDFAPKTEGRVGALLGKWDEVGPPGIQFPDGNKCARDGAAARLFLAHACGMRAARANTQHAPTPSPPRDKCADRCPPRLRRRGQGRERHARAQATQLDAQLGLRV